MTKKVSKTLELLAAVVIEEAESNKEFAAKIEAILAGAGSVPSKAKTDKSGPSGGRAANRRDPAVLDPISMCAEDEKALADRLHDLTDKELKDIIADFGMDSSKLAMKWKDRERLINLIIETSRRRASKGNAFRGG